MYVELVAVTEPRVPGLSPQDFTAYIARIGKVKSNPDRLLKYLIEHAHWSPFEHTFLTFKIETSRAMGRELLRHRSFTFQELSQRYEKILGTEPVELRQQSETNRQSSTTICDPSIQDPITGELCPASICIANHLQLVGRLYQSLIDVGVARECARAILPECSKTTILMTGSLRSWIHFLAIRDHALAQLEIQHIAREIRAIFSREFATIAAAIAPCSADETVKTAPQSAPSPQSTKRVGSQAVNTFTGDSLPE